MSPRWPIPSPIGRVITDPVKDFTSMVLPAGNPHDMGLLAVTRPNRYDMRSLGSAAARRIL